MKYSQYLGTDPQGKGESSMVFDVKYFGTDVQGGEILDEVTVTLNFGDSAAIIRQKMVDIVLASRPNGAALVSGDIVMPAFVLGIGV